MAKEHADEVWVKVLKLFQDDAVKEWVAKSVSGDWAIYDEEREMISNAMPKAGAARGGAKAAPVAVADAAKRDVAAVGAMKVAVAQAVERLFPDGEQHVGDVKQAALGAVMDAILMMACACSAHMTLNMTRAKLLNAPRDPPAAGPVLLEGQDVSLVELLSGLMLDMQGTLYNLRALLDALPRKQLHSLDIMQSEVRANVPLLLNKLCIWYLLAQTEAKVEDNKKLRKSIAPAKVLRDAIDSMYQPQEFLELPTLNFIHDAVLAAAKQDEELRRHVLQWKSKNPLRAAVSEDGDVRDTSSPALLSQCYEAIGKLRALSRVFMALVRVSVTFPEDPPVETLDPVGPQAVQAVNVVQSTAEAAVENANKLHHSLVAMQQQKTMIQSEKPRARGKRAAAQLAARIAAESGVDGDAEASAKKPPRKKKAVVSHPADVDGVESGEGEADPASRTPTTVRRKRTPWQPEEDDAIYKALYRGLEDPNLAYGKWAQMLNQYRNQFRSTRTAVDLKDRARSLRLTKENWRDAVRQWYERLGEVPVDM
ncbi:hypothetical protein FVE85_8962 [Porphyridium purpureum]|uniref:Myb-like domain-containing protein n=1 Tax=Porphyridium purpureum TaxID=35688 RepID=A0A5J4YFZ2_PORPP|nr:hypothetical protein FVE85_8962 [Porphyridium purpureum]|eukprot:POR2366..scf226_27